MKKYVLIAFALLAAGSLSAQNNFTLSSPDRPSCGMEVSVDGIVEYSVLHGDDVMVAPSAVSMTTAGVPSFGVDARLAGFGRHAASTRRSKLRSTNGQASVTISTS